MEDEGKLCLLVVLRKALLEQPVLRMRQLVGEAEGKGVVGWNSVTVYLLPCMEPWVPILALTQIEKKG